SVAPEAKRPPGIVPGRFQLAIEKVLGEKNVFIAITIQIGNGDPKGRCHLRLDWKSARFKMVPAVEKHSRFEPVRLPRFGGLEVVTKDLFYAAASVSTMVGDAAAEEGHGLGHRGQLPFWNDLLQRRLEVGLNHVFGTIAVQVAIIDSERLRSV